MIYYDNTNYQKKAPVVLAFIENMLLALVLFFLRVTIDELVAPALLHNVSLLYLRCFTSVTRNIVEYRYIETYDMTNFAKKRCYLFPAPSTVTGSVD
jgi:hypothetical protein